MPIGYGPSGHGSSITGADSATLTINNVQNDDLGQYDCVLSNACGSELSTAATLAFNNGGPCCPADFTGDDVVNISDLLIVVSFWGPCPGGCDADIAPPGGNGTVNIEDLLAVVVGWGACP